MVGIWLESMILKCWGLEVLLDFWHLFSLTTSLRVTGSSRSFGTDEILPIFGWVGQVMMSFGREFDLPLLGTSTVLALSSITLESLISSVESDLSRRSSKYLIIFFILGFLCKKYFLAPGWLQTSTKGGMKTIPAEKTKL